MPAGYWPEPARQPALEYVEPQTGNPRPSRLVGGLGRPGELVPPLAEGVSDYGAPVRPRLDLGATGLRLARSLSPRPVQFRQPGRTEGFR